jgi:ParB family chromosome partitioning protein
MGSFGTNGSAPAHGGEVAGAVYREVPVTSIKPNPKQPRQVFDEDALAELEHSIREFGLMQPIVVRELPGGEYELVMGERRLRASQQAELESIPAIVRQTADEAMLRDALLENIHRVQLNPLEEAAAYQQLLDEFAVTHEELASRIGRSRPAITNTIRLLKLPLRCSDGSPPACFRPATHVRCSPLTTREARKSWQRGSSRKACRSARPRKRSC